jgi:ParB-like chromosome segregation protein Spo0J
MKAEELMRREDRKSEYQIEIPLYTMDDDISRLVNSILLLDDHEKVNAINKVKIALHEISPFKNEPVDCVTWVKNDLVVANEYNPNKVAPPEMELLEVSIMNDGYTQPIVTWQSNNKIEVVDGFHRSRVGKESKIVNTRVNGYLPVVAIRTEQSSKNDRIASTIRHNRARGKHQVDAMSEIVIELKNRNWTNKRIAKQLGMDEEEVLRLCQISGLEHLFGDSDFSRAWEASNSENDYTPITDDLNEEEIQKYRTANTNDPNRIFHTYDKWECHKAGFYASSVSGKTAKECEQEYADFLSNGDEFRKALDNVLLEWKHSCEHYLTNTAMNRIAWLGQAAMCYAKSIPSKFCGGFNLLSEAQKQEANEIALEYLNKWLDSNNMDQVDMNTALSVGRQVEIY